MNHELHFLRFVQYLYRCTIVILIMTVLLICGICILPFSRKVASSDAQAQGATVKTKRAEPSLWSAPDSLSIPSTPEGDLIRYGRSLVANTALYLGPRGSVLQTTNGMNCQNCHLKAGKKIFGNNYSAVSPTYPKFRARSGTVETIEKRINDCIERSLNGHPLKAGSRELQAFSAYILWVGHQIEKGVTPYGAGIWDLTYLDRAASPEKGKI